MVKSEATVRTEDDDNIVVLPLFRFPEHWIVQDWLTNTEHGEDFELVLTEVLRGQTSQTVPGLRIKETKRGFKWILRGEKGARELEQEVLDYAKQRRYNT